MQNAYTRGYEKGRLFMPDTQNPYGFLTPEYKAWHKGWIAGMFHSTFIDNVEENKEAIYWHKSMFGNIII